MPLHIEPIVAVDTQTLVFGVREEGPDDKCKRAKWLFDQFTARKTQVILPSIAVSEYLTVVDAAQHQAVIEQLGTRFIIQPFDHHCAALAAELFKMGAQLRAKGEPGGRAILRADSLIIATASIFGARTLYTNDSECRSLADKVMKGEDLPNPPTDLLGQFIE